jgi:large subunit ribosomal protein L29
MKSLKASDINNWSVDQLNKQILENQSRITALQFQKSIGQLENTAQFVTLRKDIARLKTVLSARKNAEAATAATAKAAK